MATPNLQVLTKNFTANQLGTNILTWDIKDATGAVQDLTGFAAQCNTRPSSGANPTFGPAELGSHGTWAYGADGVLKLTLPIWNTKYLAAIQNAYSVMLSNDSFTTSQLAAQGNITVNNGIV